MRPSLSGVEVSGEMPHLGEAIHILGQLLRGEWRSDALFLPDKPNGNGVAAQGDPGMAVSASSTDEAGDPMPF